jgi:hypothetical protein
MEMLALEVHCCCVSGLAWLAAQLEVLKAGP